MRLLISFLLCVAALGAASAQDMPGRQGGWQRGMGRGTVGTVTETAADHYIIKTELGEAYTVHFSVNTRIMKQPPGSGPRGPRNNQNGGLAEEGGMRTPPTPIKAADIKIGDVIAAGGDLDATAKSVGAVFVLLVDPERAKEMRAMEANYGKTWLAGRVTAINETKVDLEGGPDGSARSFTADENTTLRKRREPVTLADVRPGDMVRVEGTVKDGVFLAKSVVVMGPPPERPGNRKPASDGSQSPGFGDDAPGGLPPPQ